MTSSTTYNPTADQSENDLYYYDEAAADRPVQFIERFCTHIKGELQGKPILLEDWQKNDIIRPAFGWKRKENDKRRYRKVYVELPRKNGKSALGSCFGVYLLCADGEKGGEIYSAAGDREQARLVFDPAKQMIEQSYFLSTRLKSYKSSIVHEKSKSFYKVISADANTKHGFNAHGIIFDEMHVQPNSELYDVLVTSTGARSQPLTIIITTAGVKGTFGEQMHDYALKVRDGVLKDDSFLPVIYCADEEDDIFDEATWKKANPGYGTICKKEYFEEQVTRVRNQPSYINTFKQLHLNIWVGSLVAWIADLIWQKCFGEKYDCRGRQCFGGLDLASTRDTSSLCLFFPPDETITYPYAQWYFFVPEETVLQRTKNENINYQQWVDEGWIVATPGNVQDYAFIEEEFDCIAENYDLVSTAYDRWNSSDIVVRLSEKGHELTPFGQGFSSMSTPTKEVEKMLVSNNFCHGSNPVARWQLSNVVVRKDPSGNIKPDKQKSKDKIDGIVALIMAYGEYLTWLANQPEKSPYETRGVRVIKSNR